MKLRLWVKFILVLLLMPAVAQGFRSRTFAQGFQAVYGYNPHGVRN